jgi:hypothetical protein
MSGRAIGGSVPPPSTSDRVTALPGPPTNVRIASRTACLPRQNAPPTNPSRRARRPAAFIGQKPGRVKGAAASLPLLENGAFLRQFAAA